MDEKARETLKSRAWDVLCDNGAALDAKAVALAWLIEAHYWRAKGALETMPLRAQRKVHGARYHKGYELDIDVYSRHWLASVVPSLVESTALTADVVARFSEIYGYKPELSPFLPHGHTMYQL